MAKWIIVVDDDTANLKVAGFVLSKNNMRVTALKSGQALLDYVTANGFPDLILLDILMPGMDGFATLDLLRRKEAEMGVSQTPVIFLTADEDIETEKKGFEVGVSDFIRKPFNADVLIKRIDNIVTQSGEMRALRSEASRDKLTGLINKAAAEEVMTSLCSGKSGYLLMIDLDSFKLVNDLYGHDKGDDILVAFSRILTDDLPGKSVIARVGGDEFTAFATEIRSEGEIAVLTKKLNEDLLMAARELLGADMSIPLGTSVGAVAVPDHGNDYKALLKLADKSLNNVKKNGKHGYEVYTIAGLDEDKENRLDIFTISEILGERNIPDVALQLDKDAFSYVYRYVMRDIKRNRKCALKILFTLEQKESDPLGAAAYKDMCDEFGSHVRESLRKSDILTRSSFNQYFVFLTEIRPEACDKVVEHLISSWYDRMGDRVTVIAEKETVNGS
ncbi:diguanylate cyclase (GGDEF) domain-containing protein [Ruminococcaceae bacterium YRB3002]|nr:diguanylate cyclase (GGDEF) domain-containing protein [Ruminococcaceae bacterium YRB3002]